MLSIIYLNDDKPTQCIFKPEKISEEVQKVSVSILQEETYFLCGKAKSRSEVFLLLWVRFSWAISYIEWSLFLAFQDKFDRSRTDCSDSPPGNKLHIRQAYPEDFVYALAREFFYRLLQLSVLATALLVSEFQVTAHSRNELQSG